ncbi:MAG: hypothetical protein JO063_01210 [Pseudonocardiales bacterium]|nr:hypothetical protein [Pseudonocardiales bacterium]MBV9031806.1 hypothetical protein [Pseudonocardiales bacterium]MBW0008732.1 hypothetical protein [Pseudonocardiales bacterium]
MSDALSFAEVDGQRAELLPARTVLSMFSVGGPRGGDAGNAGAGGTGGAGGAGSGEAEASASHFYSEGDVILWPTGGVGGTGGAAAGGPATGGDGVVQH